MQESATTPLRTLEQDRDHVVLVDASCGACDDCRAGHPLACTRPLAETDRARALAPALPARVVASDMRAVLAVAALADLVADGPIDGPVLMLGESAELLADLARGLGVDVLVARDHTDPAARAALAATHPTGRAAVVVTADDDLRAAVRAVRRGGHVCAPAGAGPQPSVTEIVQREITLVPPTTLRGIRPAEWAAALAAA